MATNHEMKTLVGETAPTRLSLLIRLRDNDDTDAWTQFVEIYSPLVFGLARRCGLQDSDAADLVQEVMGEVTKSIGRFEYDPKIGKFRSWLYKIAKRAVSRMQSKQRRQPIGAGDSDTFRMLDNLPDSHDQIQEYWDNEYQRHLLDWAAERVQAHFSDVTWQAFWLTSVEQKSPQEVSKRLGLSVGSIYVAKSRVLKRLADKIREIDDSQ